LFVAITPEDLYPMLGQMSSGCLKKTNLVCSGQHSATPLWIGRCGAYQIQSAAAVGAFQIWCLSTPLEF